MGGATGRKQRTVEAIRHGDKQSGKRSRKRHIATYLVAAIYRAMEPSNRPANRLEKRNGGREAACSRCDWAEREAEREAKQIVLTEAAGMIEPTGYGGTIDAPDMQYEGRGELQKKKNRRKSFQVYFSEVLKCT